MANDEHDDKEEETAAAEARRTILARRARFVAATLAGITAACGGESTGGNPQVCLSPVAAGGGMNIVGSGGAPQPCLSMIAAGGGGSGGYPQPCLSPGGTSSIGGKATILDAATDAPTDGAMSGGAPGSGGTTGAGGLPLPCLSPPAPAKDSGSS